jgi:excinuclease ABC subunit C
LNNKIVQEKLKNLPKDPGVYLYRNSKGKIIYVGKAINLKNRVKSYFIGEKEVKTAELVGQITDLEWIITGSEIEALILESDLIKRYKPKYNINLKDDKNYCYIKFTNDSYPRVFVVRQIIDDKAEYFGPFTDAVATRATLKYLRKIFPFCTCYSPSDSVCLYYHLKLCPGHGEKYISVSDYKKNIAGLKNFLNGKKEKIIKEIESNMKLAAKDKEFEKAAEFRDKLNVLSKIRFQHIMEEKRDLNLDKALVNLKAILDLKEIPVRIECYDISNIFGKNAVGSMVVFENGIAKKSDYRRFEIKSVRKIDDFAMHQEVAKRRIKNLASKDSSFSKMPSLIIIDGGKGQLSSVLEAVREYELPIKYVGLAKRLEEIVIFDGQKFDIRMLEPNSEAFYLIQRIRDEAHRFAITYHRGLRSKELTKSSLDNIVGIGPKKKKLLMTTYGTLDKIREADIEELAKIVGIKTAKEIKENL